MAAPKQGNDVEATEEQHEAPAPRRTAAAKPQPLRCRCGSQVFSAPACYVLLQSGDGVQVDSIWPPPESAQFTCVDCGDTGTLAYLKGRLNG